MPARKFKFKTNSNNTLAFTTPILLVLLLMIGAGFSYTVRQSMNADVEQYLTSLSRQVWAVLSYRNGSIFNLLESCAAELETASPLLGADSLERLQQWQRRQDGFSNMSILNPHGTGVTSQGDAVQTWDDHSVEQAFAGERAAWLADDGQGESFMHYAVPIYNKGQVAGVLCGTRSLSQMQEALHIGGFSGQAHAQLMRADGSLLLVPQDSHIPPEQTNFLDWQAQQTFHKQQRADLEVLRRNLQSNDYGVYVFTLDGGQRMIAHYVPFGYGDWYYLLLVPWESVLQSTGSAAQVQIALAFSFVGLCMVLLLGIFVIWQHERKQLTSIAYMDSITSGLNMQGFMKAARICMQENPQTAYTMVSFDINKFRAINDAFGNQAGNNVLRHVKNCADALLQYTECFGRIGADKFVMLLESSEPAELEHRLTSYVLDINAFNEQLSEKNYLRFSFGLYPIDQQDMPAEVAWDRANSARKASNHMWGGSLCAFAYYQEENRMQQLREKEIENTMAAALDTGAFEIYFQPCYRLKEDSISAAEALVRWIDPKFGLLQPRDFLPLLEKNGFIVQLDLYVFEQVCAVMQRWQRAGVPLIPISVNLSRLHLMDPHFLDKYSSIAQRYEVSPAHFLMELKESVVFENITLLQATIQRIHALGFRLVLDDFGKGFSALNMLRDLQVDALKLDKIFFTGENHTNPRSKLVVDSIIEMARGLDMETVAEGIQTSEQLRFLRNAECDLIQGDVLAPAMPLEEFELMVYGKIVQINQQTS